jgi:hypothetical protein
MKKQSRPRTAAELDTYFENNDISELLDTNTKRFNIDLPVAVLRKLDLQANRIGLTRQALVKYWISEHLGLTDISKKKAL